MKILDYILDLFYPRRCPFCRRLLNRGQLICRFCPPILPRVSPELQAQHFKYIADCYSPLYYEKAVRDSLLRYKFQGAAAYADAYGELLAQCIDENRITCDIVTWVPLSRRRLRKRGYDQARLLAEAAARHMNLPCEMLLRKTRNNPAQSGTASAGQRRQNVRGVYEPVKPELISGKCVLLVDDIVTTGSTLGECAKMLKSAGAEKILALTLARARD